MLSNKALEQQITDINESTLNREEKIEQLNSLGEQIILKRRELLLSFVLTEDVVQNKKALDQQTTVLQELEEINEKRKKTLKDVIWRINQKRSHRI
jgi:hypothetical protein